MKTKTNYYEEVKDYASTIPDGCTANSLVCPACSGGSSQDRSFCVTKDNTLIKYICFRASCGFRGILGDNPNNPREHSKKPTVMPYRKPTGELSEHERDWLLTKFEICPEEWKWGIEDSRVIMPVADYRGYIIGHVARNYPELSGVESKAKSIAYWENERSTKLHFPSTTHLFPAEYDHTLWLVEDIVSAEKISRDRHSAALLGTHISDEMVGHILDLGYKKIVLWLDDDAFMKACHYADRYGLVFPQGASVVHTANDPKDLTFKEIEEIVYDQV